MLWILESNYFCSYYFKGNEIINIFCPTTKKHIIVSSFVWTYQIYLFLAQTVRHGIQDGNFFRSNGTMGSSW